MTSLVDEVRSAQTDEGHLQQRILDEHARHDAGDGHEIVLDPQGLRLTCKHPQEDVRQHGEDVPCIAADVTEAS